MVGANYSVIVSDYDESLNDEKDPFGHVVLSASEKAKSVSGKLDDDCIIIGADTVVVIDGKILGKPKTENDAIDMLLSLSGRMHKVITGICLLDSKNNKMHVNVSVTEVYFTDISRALASKYVDESKPFDKAGSYAIQDKGALFVRQINGDFYNVVGLPISLLNEMLQTHFNMNIN